MSPRLNSPWHYMHFWIYTWEFIHVLRMAIWNQCLIQIEGIVQLCWCILSMTNDSNNTCHINAKKYTTWKLTQITPGKILLHVRIDGLVQDCSNSIADALELLQSCTKPSISFSPALTSKQHYSDVIMSAIASQITGVLIIYSTVCSGT